MRRWNFPSPQILFRVRPELNCKLCSNGLKKICRGETAVRAKRKGGSPKKFPLNSSSNFRFAAPQARNLCGRVKLKFPKLRQRHNPTDDTAPEGFPDHAVEYKAGFQMLKIVSKLEFEFLLRATERYLIPG